MNLQTISAIAFLGLGLLCATLAVVASFRHRDGMLVTKRGLKEQAIFLTLMGLCGMIAIAILQPQTWRTAAICSGGWVLIGGFYYLANGFNVWLVKRMAGQLSRRKENNSSR